MIRALFLSVALADTAKAGSDLVSVPRTGKVRRIPRFMLSYTNQERSTNS